MARIRPAARLILPDSLDEARPVSVVRLSPIPDAARVTVIEGEEARVAMLDGTELQ
jgi:hypothetical protein